MTTFEVLKAEYPEVLNELDNIISVSKNLENSSIEEEINKLTPDEIVDLYLRGNGIHGWLEFISKLTKVLYHADDRKGEYDASDIDKNDASKLLRNIASVMSGKKTYRIVLSAEGQAAGLVDLTDSEYEVAQKILNPENWRDKYEESYSPEIYFTKVTDDVLIAHYKALAINNGDL